MYSGGIGSLRPEVSPRTTGVYGPVAEDMSISWPYLVHREQSAKLVCSLICPFPWRTPVQHFFALSQSFDLFHQVCRVWPFASLVWSLGRLRISSKPLHALLTKSHTHLILSKREVLLNMAELTYGIYHSERQRQIAWCHAIYTYSATNIVRSVKFWIAYGSFALSSKIHSFSIRVHSILF